MEHIDKKDWERHYEYNGLRIKIKTNENKNKKKLNPDYTTKWKKKDPLEISKVEDLITEFVWRYLDSKAVKLEAFCSNDE